MVASSAYLKLVVPYRPGVDDDAAACARGHGAQRAAALLDCLQQRHAVQLDGASLPALRYDIGSDPRTDRPALVAMIDVRALPPGRHVLRIARPASDPAAAHAEIAFWR